MPTTGRNDVTEIYMTKEFEELISRAETIHKAQFGSSAFLGRCIFLSWYCGIGTCTFCFRSTQKHKIKFPEQGRRTKESIYTEAIIAKHQGWKLEFLTGGHDMFPDSELIEIASTVSEIFGEKIWVNIGALDESALRKFSPFVEGIVASIETPNPLLHKKVCPDKDMGPYLEMLRIAGKLGMKKSITLVLGIGETIADYPMLKKMIADYSLDRITIYSLRPVKGTPFETGPSPEYVAEWIARTRIDFPSLEIVAGSSETRIPELGLLLRAGANAITKIPATKIFGTTGAKEIHDQVRMAKREFTSNLKNLLEGDLQREVTRLHVSDELKKKIIVKLEEYKHNRLEKAYKSFEMLE